MTKNMTISGAPFATNTLYRPLDDSVVHSDVDQLVSWSAKLGVSIQVEIDDAIFISDFGRNCDDASTKGNGRLVLDALLHIADRHQVRTETSYMSDEPKLGAYYRSFGFVEDGIPEAITNLTRLPRPQ